jgi:hypothetical protein
MLMVIFGAGASYDSSPDFPPPLIPAAQQNPGNSPAESLSRERWRPPLATQLFHDPNRAFADIVANANYRKLLPILPNLRRPRNGSVEEELESLLAEGTAKTNADLERNRQLFAVRYYLHDLLLKVSNEWSQHTSGVTNYVTLLDQIRHLNTASKPICLVTFNYDLLLDRALLSFDYQPQPLDHRYFDAHPTLRLFKPHGSVDWARYIEAPPNTRLGIEQVIEQANTLKLSNTYIRADATHTASIHAFERPIAPAIAVPVQTKTEDNFEWPPSHSATLEQLLPSVTQILIIGWQGKEGHFLRLLRERLPTGGLTQLTHLQVVGKDPAESQNIREQFTQQIARNVMHPYNGPTGGFSHFVAQELVRFFFED